MSESNVLTPQNTVLIVKDPQKKVSLILSRVYPCLE